MTSTVDRAATSTDELLRQLKQIAATGNSELMTLPAGVYKSQEIFDLEMEKIFRPGWVMVGRVDQVSQPGDYMSVDVANEMLVITRDNDGAVHVMSRVCRHRWLSVCEGSGNAKTLNCPYHAWKYELDGKLRSAPEMRQAPSFEKDKLGLFPVRFEVWQGFIFVNLSGDAEPLAPQLQGVEGEIAEYGLSDWKTVWTTDYGVVDWDWKVLQDNGDCYHHIGLHKDSLLEAYPLSLIWDKPNNGAYTFTGNGVAPHMLVPDAEGRPCTPSKWEPPKELTAFQRENLCLLYVHPNYFIGLEAYAGVVIRAFPVGPGRMHMIGDFIVPPHAPAEPDFDTKLKEWVDEIASVTEEDIWACTAVQKALNSQWAGRSPLSPKELCVAQFAAWYARQLTAE